jgi:hypothetical protein
MSERLDRIEALLLITAERLNQTAEQQQRNTTDIDNLLGAISTTDVEVRSLTQAVTTNEQRFAILREDAIADREENRRRFDAQQEVIQSLLLALQSGESSDSA